MGQTLAQGPYGFKMPKWQAYCYNRTGSTTTLGQVYQLLLDQSESESSTFGDGASTDGFANIEAAVAGTEGQGQMCVVAEEAAADDALCLCTLRGVTNVLCDGGTDIVAGDALEVDATGELIRVTNAAAQPIAISGVAYTDTTGALKKVYFDGYTGAFSPHVS
jgi:hypothetical protein